MGCKSTTYYTQGGRIVAETRRMYGFVNGAWRNGHTATLEFIYDESGRPVQLIWNDGHSAYQQVFNYVLNLQGDVVQLRQASDGAVVATYLYNAWGEILSSSGWMAGHNPLRYRGKYYDNALGMYYLQSRYYDPAIGRFINGDGLISTGQGLLGYNMFAYCLNNPVMLSDHTGYWGCSSQLTISHNQMTHAQRAHMTLALRQARGRLSRAAAVRAAGHTTATLVAARARVVEINGEWTVGIHQFAPFDGPVDRAQGLRDIGLALGLIPGMPGFIPAIPMAAANFYEYGFTWRALYYTGIDAVIGVGVGRLINTRSLSGASPHFRSALKEVVGAGMKEMYNRTVGATIDWFNTASQRPVGQWHGPGCR